MTLQDFLSITVIRKDKHGNDVEISPDFRVTIQQSKFNRKYKRMICSVHAVGEYKTIECAVKGNELKILDAD